MQSIFDQLVDWLKKIAELKEPLAWRNHEELKYVFAMNELF